MPARSTRLFLALALLCLPACELPATSWGDREPVPVRERSELVPAPAAPNRLHTVAWNIKYGAGRIDFWFDYWGDRVQMTREEVEGNMANIYTLLREVDPDVFITSEIEVSSRRSAYYDMVEGILEHTDLNYAAFFPNWQSRYVPSEGVGRVEMGNAIFSKYPIVEAERIAHSDRTDLPVHEDYFYLHRNVGRAVLDVGGGRRVAVLAVHTEAYETDGTRSRQIGEVRQLMEVETLPFLVGGDFNAIPPTAARTEGFPDEHLSAVGTEFENPPYVLTDMQPFFDAYVPAITLERIGATEASQRRYFTHSVIGPDTIGTDGQPGFWNRTLDYLFVKAPARFDPSTTDVLQRMGDSGIQSDPIYLSDHAPVVGTWELSP